MKKALLYQRQDSRWQLLRTLANLPLRAALGSLRKKHLGERRKKIGLFAFDYISDEIIIDGLYELNELDTIFEWISSYLPQIYAGVAVDIGANIGNHSLYFSDLFSAVISFEPVRRTFGLLKFNSELASNITCFPVGISDSAGVLSFEKNEANSGGARIVEKPTTGYETVEVNTLDYFIPRDVNVTLIKIDAEGHELKVLRGCEPIIRSCKPIVLFEQLRTDFVGGSSPSLEFLKELGYSYFAAVQKYPRAPARLRGAVADLYSLFARMIAGPRSNIVLKETFDPDFYPIIMAVPSHLIGNLADPVS